MSKEQPNILIDFDHTLFDTTAFREKHNANVKADTDFSELLYPDAMAFLEYAEGFGKLCLYSEGPVEFQKEKIRRILKSS